MAGNSFGSASPVTQAEPVQTIPRPANCTFQFQKKCTYRLKASSALIPVDDKYIADHNRTGIYLSVIKILIGNTCNRLPEKDLEIPGTD
jgi:hypothetical protein